MKFAPPMVGRLIFLSVIVMLLSGGCRAGADGPPEGPPLKLTLAVSPSICSGLIAVADEKGYFKEAGIDVSIQLYPSGYDALKAMRRGDARVATTADITFSAEIYNDPSLRVLAVIGTTLGSQIVARKDSGIQTPSDLKGKRIGYCADTVTDYFLYAFLLIENISPDEITAVDIAPSRQVEALLNGDVDAVSVIQRYAFQATTRLGANAVSWPSQSNLHYHWVLATKEGTARSAEPLKRLLNALLKAETFVQSNAAETKSILARKWGYDPAVVQASWTQTRFSVSLNQSVVISLQNYLLWKTKKTGGTEDPPDILNYLHTDVMDAVAPKSVTIFR